jgi:N6-adenosine-specific RNA methylase IME4
MMSKLACRYADKKRRRALRERQLGKKQRAMPAKLYGVIYADPPWRFEPYSRDTGMDRAADNHYPTMDLNSIMALQVPAAPDCILFLWATVPMLLQALAVMSAWGFKYKTHFVWMKDKTGTGYWNRNNHEILLLGTRGGVPAPASDNYPSAMQAKRTKHSAKPPMFRELIEQTFPTLPRIELFARERHAGWDAWGNEVEDCGKRAVA